MNSYLERLKQKNSSYLVRCYNRGTEEEYIRYKEGGAPTIEKEYQAIPEKLVTGNAEFVNQVIFKEGTVNVLKCKETRVKKREEVTTVFTWITSFGITEKNALKPS